MFALLVEDAELVRIVLALGIRTFSHDKLATVLLVILLVLEAIRPHVFRLGSEHAAIAVAFPCVEASPKAAAFVVVLDPVRVGLRNDVVGVWVAFEDMLLYFVEF
jgi:hypothetical protein